MRIFRHFAVLAVTVFLLSGICVTAFAAFPDVPSDHPYKTAIDAMEELHIFKGDPSGNLRPDDAVSRSEMVTLLIRLVMGDKGARHFTKVCFPDVKVTVWYQDATCEAKVQGWAKGYPNGSFMGEKPIELVEFASMLSKAFKFDVAADPIWFKGYINKLADLGAIPMSADTFDHHVTRAEAAEIFYRLVGNISNLPSQNYASLDQNQQMAYARASQASTTFATTSTSTANRFAQDPAVVEKTLSNGLTYFYRHNTEPKAKTYVELIVKAGSAFEPVGKHGLAHFIEHMVFNGTSSYPAGAIYKYLPSVGIQVGADANAFTSPDETVYMLPVPSDAKNVQEVVKILSEMAGKALFDPKEIDNERGVILSERRQDLGKGQRMSEFILSHLFPSSGYQHSTIGTEEEINALKRDDFVKFYQDYYRTDNMAITIVGDVSESVADAAVNQYFGDLPPTPSAQGRSFLNEPPLSEQSILTFTDPETTQTTVSFAYRNPAFNTRVPENEKKYFGTLYLSQLINHRLGDLVSSLPQDIATPTFTISPLTSKDLLVEFDIAAAPAKTNDAVRLLYQEIQRLLQQGVTQQEMDAAFNELKASLESAVKSEKSVSSDSWASAMLNAFYSDDVITSYDQDLDFLNSIKGEMTPEYANALIREFFSTQNFTLLFDLPKQQYDTFSIPDMKKVLSSVEQQTFSATAVQQSAVPFDKPTGTGKIVDQKDLPTQIGMKRVEFDNGLVLFVKTTNFEADGVEIGIDIHGGDLFVPKEKQPTFKILGSALIGGGTTKRSYRDLQTVAEQKQMSFSLSPGGYDISYSGSSVVASFEDLLALSREFLFQPALQDDGVARAKAEYNRVLEQYAANPQAQFGQAYQQLISNNAPYTIVPSAADIQAVSKQDLMALHDQYFMPNNMQMTVVGNISADKIIALVSQYFGTLPKGTAPVFDPAVKQYTFPKGLNEKSSATGSEPIADTIFSFAGVNLQNMDSLPLQILASILQERLQNRLREQLGATYGVSVVETPFSYQDGGTFEISFQSDPSKADGMVTEVKKALQEIRDGMVTADELQRATEPLKKSYQTNLTSNAYWLWLVDEFIKLPYTFDIDEQKRLPTITAADINAVAKKYLTLDSYVHYTLLPKK